MIPALIILVIISAWAVVVTRARDDRGERVAGPGATAAAVVMLLASLAGSGSVLAPLLRSSLAQTHSSLESSSTDLVDRLAAAATDVEALPVLTELNDRIGKQQFTAEERARVLELLADRGKGAEADVLPMEWAVLAARVWEHGWLPEDEISPAVVAALAWFEVDGAQPMTVGEVSLIMKARTSPHFKTAAGDDRMVSFEARVESVRLEGRALQRVSSADQLVGRSTSTSSIHFEGSGNPRFSAAVPPGRYQATVELAGTMGLGRRGREPDGLDADIRGVTMRWREQRTMEVLVLGELPDMVKEVTDDETRVALLGAIEIGSATGWRKSRSLELVRARDEWVLRGAFTVDEPPVALQGKLLLRMGQREIEPRHVRISIQRAARRNSHVFEATLEAPPSAPIDVIFRPKIVPDSWRNDYYEGGGPVPVWSKTLIWHDVPFTLVEDSSAR